MLEDKGWSSQLWKTGTEDWRERIKEKAKEYWSKTRTTRDNVHSQKISKSEEKQLRKERKKMNSIKYDKSKNLNNQEEKGKQNNETKKKYYKISLVSTVLW